MSIETMTTTIDPSMMSLLNEALRRAASHNQVHAAAEERDDGSVRSVHERLRQNRALTPPGDQIDSLVLLRAIRDE